MITVTVPIRFSFPTDDPVKLDALVEYLKGVVILDIDTEDDSVEDALDDELGPLTTNGAEINWDEAKID